jgi:hypothetical protein
MLVELALGSRRRNEPFGNFAFVYDIGRMTLRKGFAPCILI